MISRILVPLDGSELAEAILPYVEELARRLRSEVYFIQFVDVQLKAIGGGLSAETLLDPNVFAEQLEATAKMAEAYLSTLVQQWQARGIDATEEVVRQAIDQPRGAGIVEFAHSHDIDLIAMSTHGRSGLSHLVFGSVAEQVVREAGIPVMLVRPGHKTMKTGGSPSTNRATASQTG